MSDQNTIKMIEAYFEEPSLTGFFMGMFRSPRENFHESKDVEIDIVRSGREIAIAVHDLTSQYNNNETEIYTNKRLTPPILKEKVPLNSWNLLNRQPGEDPFKAPSYRANLIRQFMRGAQKVQGKIFRTIELQCAQVLQTGTITLVNSDGVPVYTIDYSGKVSHFPTVPISWSAGTADIQQDLINGADVIRRDGKQEANQIYFGSLAYKNFLNDATIQGLLNNRRIVIGQIGPMAKREDGANFRGMINIGENDYEMFTYPGLYDDPETGLPVEFLAPDKVIMRASNGRMDLTYGGIPNAAKELGIRNAVNLPELPRRFTDRSRGVDLFANVWLSEDGETLNGGVQSRPLAQPTAIDTFMCMDTEI